MTRPGFHLLPLLLLLLPALSCAQAPIRYAVPGDNVTFQAVLSGDPKEISWTFNGNKIVELTKIYPPDFYQNWAERVEADLPSGRLTIRNVSAEDSGTYNADVIVTKSVITPTSFFLSVIDPVCKPNITSSSDGRDITLHCSCPAPDVTYEWRDSNNTVVYSGQNYTLTRDPGHEETFTCVVRNAASEKNQTYTFPGTQRSHAVLFVALVLVLVIVIGIVVYCIRKRNSEAQNRIGNDVQTQQEEGKHEDRKHEEQAQEQEPMLAGDNPGTNGDVSGHEAQTNSYDSIAL